MAKNTPLTNEQKLTVMVAQRRLMARQLVIRDEVEQLNVAFNQALAAVLTANDIDFAEVSLDDNLDIVTKPIAPKADKSKKSEEKK
jgi:hypothetical protein